MPKERTFRRILGGFQGVLLALVVVLSAADACAAPQLHETYGECSYACDAAKRVCLRESGKREDRIAQCEAAHRACRARCETLWPREKPVKPK